MIEIFSIPSQNVGGLLEKFEAFNRKAEKLGFPLLSYSVGESKVVLKQQYDETVYPPVFRNVKVLVKELTLESTPLLIDGWVPIVSLEHKVGGNLVKAFPGVEFEGLSKYVNYTDSCDHCGINRRRNNTVVLLKDGIEKQVGLSCVKDYLGIDPTHFAALAESLKSIRDIEEFECFGRGSDISVNFYMYCVAAVIRNVGFCSKKLSYETGKLPTSQIAIDLVFKILDYKNQDNIKEEDRELSEKALQWARDLNPKNDYENNIKVAAMQNVYEHRLGGFLASIIPAYQKSLDDEKQKFVRVESQFYGNVGDKISLALTLKHVIHLDGTYGSTRLMLMSDDIGNAYVWNCSSTISFTVGERKLVKGSIKDHRVYKDVKQTILTRCKV